MLASGSPRRRELLERLGLEFDVVPADIDESVRPGEGAIAYVERLAKEKAAAVGGDREVVIAADTTVEIDGEILGKPYTPEAATLRWRQMRGRTGMLHSGHSVIRVGGGTSSTEAHAVAAASVSFAADVTDAEIGAYVASGEPLHVAGAFTIDSLGGAFIDRVDGDPSTVVGMSLSTVRRLAGQLGVTWTDLWNRG